MVHNDLNLSYAQNRCLHLPMHELVIFEKPCTILSLSLLLCSHSNICTHSIGLTWLNLEWSSSPKKKTFHTYWSFSLLVIIFFHSRLFYFFLSMENFQYTYIYTYTIRIVYVYFTYNIRINIRIRYRYTYIYTYIYT